MEFQYFDYVRTLAKYGTMTRAARELYISQPTLSRAINRLEEQLGVSLFDRSENPLVLTKEGELYLQYTGEMVTLKKRMIREIELLNPEKKKRLVIGFPNAYSSKFLPCVLPKFFEKHSNILIDIQEMPGGVLEENLKNHSLDLAIIAATSFSPEIHCEYLETQRIVLVVPKNHPLYYPMTDNNFAVLDAADLHKINDQPFICYSSHAGMLKVCQDFFAAHNLNPKIILEVQDTATAYSLAASGMGLTMISDLRYLLRPDNIPSDSYCGYQLCDPPYTRTRVIAYPNGIPLTEAEKDFIAISKREIHKIPPVTAK